MKSLPLASLRTRTMMFSMQKFLFLLLSLVLLGPLGIDLYLPAIPAIASGLNSSEEVIQSSISLFILVMGLGQLIAGPLVDRFGRRPMADGHHRCGGVWSVQPLLPLR